MQHQYKMTESYMLREAKIEDCYKLWEWRNHPDVRKWCINTDEISYTQHKAWFEHRLIQKAGRIYILISSKNKEVGQARFNVNGKNEATINVNLNPEFIGKGMGTVLIKESTILFLKNYQNVREIKAEILMDNISSRIAFEKCDYKFFEHTKKNQKRVDIYFYQKKEIG